MDYSKVELSGLPKKLLFISGGPGCGKGTLCERLIKNLNYQHYSIGDLMRAELKSGSEEA